MDEILINGFVSFIGALLAVFIGVTLPRHFDKSDSLSEQRKWSRFFHSQILDISSKAKYPLNHEGAMKPLFQEYSENSHPYIRELEDIVNHTLSYNFSINITIFNYYKDKIPLLKPERVIEVIKIYEIVFELEKLKKEGFNIDIFEKNPDALTQIDELLLRLTNPEILQKLEEDF